MEAISSNISLPYIQLSQAQKHVTHNERVLLLDGLVQLSVITMVQPAPGTPTAGDCYIVPNLTTKSSSLMGKFAELR